jgi:phosphoserine phosphatase
MASVLVTVTGRDRPGVATWLFAALEPVGLAVLDVEQVRVHGHLVLCAELAAGADPAVSAAAVEAVLDRAPAAPRVSGSTSRASSGHDDGVEVTVAVVHDPPRGAVGSHHLVTVLAPELGAAALRDLFARVTECGANIERIVRLSSYPVTSYELEVTADDPGRLRRELSEVAAERRVDVAVQRAGLHRRAKHLIVLDVDSTLLQGEVIDLLARRAGCQERVAELTAAAMAGQLDFSEALLGRLALLAGLPAAELDALAAELVLTPGARTLVRTLRRLGYVTAVVSGGFTQVIEPIAAELGIDYVAANRLEVVDGRLTGRLVGPVVDRAGKAAALRRFAALAGVPMSQTVAVGDGANDLDMLEAAGLGIAFNAKPIVRRVADAAINVPYLDAILFLLGIARDEVEAADRTGVGAVEGSAEPEPAAAPVPAPPGGDASEAAPL